MGATSVNTIQRLSLEAPAELSGSVPETLHLAVEVFHHAQVTEFAKVKVLDAGVNIGVIVDFDYGKNDRRFA